MSDAVFSSIIGGGFMLIAAMIEYTRRTNDRDHQENGRKLDRIEGKIDGHINDHAKGQFQ